MGDMREKFGKSQLGGRFEDRRFLQGAGAYVDDIAPEGALHAVFVRADRAHGRIEALDLSAAREMPGVRLALSAGDLAEMGVTLDMAFNQVKNHDGSPGAAPPRPVLAQSYVRHVGEALAVIVAERLEQALDAAEAVEVDIAPLAVALDLEPGGPEIHTCAPGNLAYDWQIGDCGATQAAFDTAAHCVALEVAQQRVIVNSLEPRGAWAEWADGRLHLCVNGQGVWGQKRELARMLGLAPEAVRVTNPDVGGGFGMKAMPYPEYVVLAAAARALEQPVRWISARGEAMLSDNAGRDLVAHAQLAFDQDLRITGYRVDLMSNLGAYNSQLGQAIQSELFSKVLTGVYDIPAAHLRARGVYTNTAPVDAYRGAGRPEAILTIERTMDAAARQLGICPFELRTRSLIRKFPYQLLSGAMVDVGDFPRVMARARAESDWDGFALRRQASAAQGRLRGIGLAVYIESILGDPSETARLVLEGAGQAALYVGTQSNGQGHESVYAHMVARETGLAPEDVRVVQGDSDAIPHGGGTGGSRSVTVQGTAIKAVVADQVAGLAQFLADEWGVEAAHFDGQAFGAAGRNLHLTLAEAADLARGRGQGHLLDVSRKITLDGRSFPNGAHIAEVEIDPQTGVLELMRYTVVDDFGTLIAPDLVLGQIHGGVAQGIGQAVSEAGIYDRQGQLLTASFMDYAMPRAVDVPPMQVFFEPTPSVLNPLGMKGCGEAGTVGALAAMANVVADALAPAGVREIAMPFTPERIWHVLNEAGYFTR